MVIKIFHLFLSTAEYLSNFKAIYRARWILFSGRSFARQHATHMASTTLGDNCSKLEFFKREKIKISESRWWDGVTSFRWSMRGITIQPRILFSVTLIVTALVSSTGVKKPGDGFSHLLLLFFIFFNAHRLLSFWFRTSVTVLLGLFLINIHY